jgi:hypothetical protein
MKRFRDLFEETHSHQRLFHELAPEGTDYKQFCAGMKVELEHKDITEGDPVLTAKIVLAHLKEKPDYYTRLKKVEG